MFQAPNLKICKKQSRISSVTKQANLLAVNVSIQAGRASNPEFAVSAKGASRPLIQVESIASSNEQTLKEMSEMMSAMNHGMNILVESVSTMHEPIQNAKTGITCRKF